MQLLLNVCLSLSAATAMQFANLKGMLYDEIRPHMDDVEFRGFEASSVLLPFLHINDHDLEYVPGRPAPVEIHNPADVCPHLLQSHEGEFDEGAMAVLGKLITPTKPNYDAVFPKSDGFPICRYFFNLSENAEFSIPSPQFLSNADNVRKLYYGEISNKERSNFSFFEPLGTHQQDEWRRAVIHYVRFTLKSDIEPSSFQNLLAQMQVALNQPIFVAIWDSETGEMLAREHNGFFILYTAEERNFNELFHENLMMITRSFKDLQRALATDNAFFDHIRLNIGMFRNAKDVIAVFNNYSIQHAHYTKQFFRTLVQVFQTYFFIGAQLHSKLMQLSDMKVPYRGMSLLPTQIFVSNFCTANFRIPSMNMVRSDTPGQQYCRKPHGFFLSASQMPALNNYGAMRMVSAQCFADGYTATSFNATCENPYPLLGLEPDNMQATFYPDMRVPAKLDESHFFAGSVHKQLMTAIQGTFYMFMRLTNTIKQGYFDQPTFSPDSADYMKVRIITIREALISLLHPDPRFETIHQDQIDQYNNVDMSKCSTVQLIESDNRSSISSKMRKSIKTNKSPSQMRTYSRLLNFSYATGNLHICFGAPNKIYKLSTETERKYYEQLRNAYKAAAEKMSELIEDELWTAKH